MAKVYAALLLVSLAWCWNDLHAGVALGAISAAGLAVELVLRDHKWRR